MSKPFLKQQLYRFTFGYGINKVSLLYCSEYFQLILINFVVLRSFKSVALNFLDPFDPAKRTHVWFFLSFLEIILFLLTFWITLVHSQTFDATAEKNGTESVREKKCMFF